MIFGTKEDFEKLADFVLRDYLGDAYYHHKPLDIDKFAKEYLSLNVSYYDFEAESGIEGLILGDQILLDINLSKEKKTGERNFTLAHECGHRLVNLQDPEYLSKNMIYYRKKDDGHKMLRNDHDFREWQANIVGVNLLLRPTLVEWAMFTFTESDKLPYFEFANYYPDDRIKVKEMAKFLGVSIECLTYRLKELGYLKCMSIKEYDYDRNLFVPFRR